MQQEFRKDDQQNTQTHQSVVKSSNIPIMSFAPPASYQIDGTTIYPQSNPQGNGAYPTTTYQQGVSVYFIFVVLYFENNININ